MYIYNIERKKTVKEQLQKNKQLNFQAILLFKNLMYNHFGAFLPKLFPKFQAIQRHYRSHEFGHNIFITFQS